MRVINAAQPIRIVDAKTTASLLAKVLWITTAAFLFTAVGAYLSPALLGGGLSIGLFLVTFGLIFAVNIFSRTSPGLALVLFYGFALLMGIEVGPLIKMYLHTPNGVSIVFNAALTTTLGMGVMAAVAQVARFDYQRVGRMAFWALIALCLVGLLGMFVHVVSPGLYAWATLGIFSVLLVVDFMRLRDNAYGYTPVQMALSIYLDALNIFIALLQIFGNGGGRRRDGGWS